MNMRDLMIAMGIGTFSGLAAAGVGAAFGGSKGAFAPPRPAEGPPPEPQQPPPQQLPKFPMTSITTSEQQTAGGQQWANRPGGMTLGQTQARAQQLIAKYSGTGKPMYPSRGASPQPGPPPNLSQQAQGSVSQYWGNGGASMAGQAQEAVGNYLPQVPPPMGAPAQGFNHSSLVSPAAMNSSAPVPPWLAVDWRE